MLTESSLLALQTDIGKLRELIKYLRAEGYTLARVASLIEGFLPRDLLRNSMLASMAFEADRRDRHTPIEILAQLFLFDGQIDARVYEVDIPQEIRELLEDCGFVVRGDGGRVESQVTIVEFESFYFLSDRLYVNHGNGVFDVRESRYAVWPMAEWTLSLYERLDRDSGWRTFLDVGTGPGFLSLLVHERYARTVGIDINPRAVAFATINAGMNGVPGMEYKVADCFHYGGRARYDHVAFAAPAGPDLDIHPGERSLVAYGGAYGHELVLDFLGSRAEHLVNSGGCCQVWGIFAVQEQCETLDNLIAGSIKGELRISAIDPIRDGGLYIAPEAIAGGELPWNCHYADVAARPRFLDQLQRYRIREVVPAVVTVCSGR